MAGRRWKVPEGPGMGIHTQARRSMLVAVLSDIHSNVFALKAVLRDIERVGVAEVWVCGDTFGYYPWAADTFRLLQETRPVAVLGNHDAWVADGQSAPTGITGEIAQRNAADLAIHIPAALDWLADLAPTRRFECIGWKITIVHGTPDDPLEGRYYPDDTHSYPWFPREGEILLLGQTHYPLLRGNAGFGLLLNPGSVGQPRDRNPMPSWALLDLASGTAELRRTTYDNVNVVERLRVLEWDEYVTSALDKR
jgi:predicted phosphodiesterase